MQKILYKMFKKIILLLLLTTISSKINQVSSTIIEFDVDQPFDKDNHVFTFSNTAKEEKFYLVDIDIKNEAVKYEYKCQGSSGDTGGKFIYFLSHFIIKAQTGECTLNIEANQWDSKNKKTIFIHPFDKEIPVDIDKQKFNFDEYVEFDEQFPPLVFSVSNVTENVTAKFIYWRNSVEIDGKYHMLKNPFRVCLEKDCKDDITEYTFIEGKDYKIEMKTEEITSGTKKYYYLEGGTFYKISGGDDTTDGRPDILGGNHLLVNPIIYLILSILLLLN